MRHEFSVNTSACPLGEDVGVMANFTIRSQQSYILVLGQRPQFGHNLLMP